jgi:predicted acylesterase/phospholipase RssA
MENFNTPAIPLTTPFQNIGLAFSGGGFRAAAFALGALSYLDRLTIDGKPLTGNISFSSSASGGSITNILYTSYTHQGKTFADFYKKLSQELEGTRLLEQALITLNDENAWNQEGQEKQRNLINAFAKVYDRSLFVGDTLGVYWNKKHVKSFETCFNATEFYRGLSFRFQTDGKNNKRQVIGNNYLWFDTRQLATVQKIKLADILAASSCFPMGFEPIVYPLDYSYNDGPDKNLLCPELRAAVAYENYNEEVRHLSDEAPRELPDDPKQKAHIRSFGLMDGGVTDNQGLKSVMLADKKRRKRVKPDPFDLIMVTDVASYFMDHYDVPAVKQQPSWRQTNLDGMIGGLKQKVRTIGRLEVILLLASVVSMVLGVFCRHPWVHLPAFVLGTCLGTLFLVIFAARQWKTGHYLFNLIAGFDLQTFLNSIVPTEKFLSAGIVKKLLDYLRVTRLNILEQMLSARLASVMSMVSDVNLKQVRRLIFEMFYNDEHWENRRVPNFIYELSTHNITSRTNRINSKGRLGWVATPPDKALLLEGYQNMNPVAEVARLMGTTLWFDEQSVKEEKLKKIIATGQFTTCVNLLEYIISLERKQVTFDRAATALLKNLKAQLTADLQRFKAQPFFLYEDMK